MKNNNYTNDEMEDIKLRPNSHYHLLSWSSLFHNLKKKTKPLGHDFAQCWTRAMFGMFNKEYTKGVKAHYNDPSPFLVTFGSIDIVCKI